MRNIILISLLFTSWALSAGPDSTIIINGKTYTKNAAGAHFAQMATALIKQTPETTDPNLLRLKNQQAEILLNMASTLLQPFDLRGENSIQIYLDEYNKIEAVIKEMLTQKRLARPVLPKPSQLSLPTNELTLRPTTQTMPAVTPLPYQQARISPPLALPPQPQLRNDVHRPSAIQSKLPSYIIITLAFQKWGVSNERIQQALNLDHLTFNKCLNEIAKIKVRSNVKPMTFDVFTGHLNCLANESHNLMALLNECKSHQYGPAPFPIRFEHQNDSYLAPSPPFDIGTNRTQQTFLTPNAVPLPPQPRWIDGKVCSPPAPAPVPIMPTFPPSYPHSGPNSSPSQLSTQPPQTNYAFTTSTHNLVEDGIDFDQLEKIVLEEFLQPSTTPPSYLEAHVELTPIIIEEETEKVSGNEVPLPRVGTKRPRQVLNEDSGPHLETQPANHGEPAHKKICSSRSHKSWATPANITFYYLTKRCGLTLTTIQEKSGKKLRPSGQAGPLETLTDNELVEGVKKYLNGLKARNDKNAPAFERMLQEHAPAFGGTPIQKRTPSYPSWATLANITYYYLREKCGLTQTTIQEKSGKKLRPSSRAGPLETLSLDQLVEGVKDYLNGLKERKDKKAAAFEKMLKKHAPAFGGAPIQKRMPLYPSWIMPCNITYYYLIKKCGLTPKKIEKEYGRTLILHDQTGPLETLTDNQVVEGVKKYLNGLKEKNDKNADAFKRILQKYAPDFGGTPIQKRTPSYTSWTPLPVNITFYYLTKVCGLTRKTILEKSGKKLKPNGQAGPLETLTNNELVEGVKDYLNGLKERKDKKAAAFEKMLKKYAPAFGGTPIQKRTPLYPSWAKPCNITYYHLTENRGLTTKKIEKKSGKKLKASGQLGPLESLSHDQLIEGIRTCRHSKSSMLSCP